MYTTSLRKVGGSMMLAVPPVLLEALRMRPGATLGITVERGRLVVEPKIRPRYALAELLAQCNTRAPRSREDKAWSAGGRVGGELL